MRYFVGLAKTNFPGHGTPCPYGKIAAVVGVWRAMPLIRNLLGKAPWIEDIVISLAN
jgi:hypothetical protein